MYGASASGARIAAHASARIIQLPHPIARRGRRPARELYARDDSGVRWPLVMSARARLAAGYYDRPNVLCRIADAVLREILPA